MAFIQDNGICLIIVLVSLVILFLVLFILAVTGTVGKCAEGYNNQEKFKNIISSFDINKLKPEETVIIVGKGPNIEDFIENINLYSKFDKLGYNSSIFIEEIKFKYYFQADFNVKKIEKDYFNTPRYNKRINNLHKKHFSFSNYKEDWWCKTFEYAINNNIKPVILKKLFRKGEGIPWYNTPPKCVLNNPKVTYVNIFEDPKYKNIRLEGNTYYINFGGTQKRLISGTAINYPIYYLIAQGYKNIMFAGVTVWKDKDGYNKGWEQYTETIQKDFPDVKFYDLYPL